jgi:hypothetical protein
LNLGEGHKISKRSSYITNLLTILQDDHESRRKKSRLYRLIGSIIKQEAEANPNEDPMDLPFTKDLLSAYFGERY